MSNMNIDTCALLVELNTSVWTARKLDRKVSDEVEQTKGAKSKGAARVNKNLLAGRSELEEITKHITAVRAFVYDNTFPWSDAGQRLLPTARFMDFDRRMQAFKEEFDARVQEFVTIYPTLITAQAMALGDMFRRDEYPSAGEIATKFDFRYDYLPVPASGDFRVDVGNEALTELEQRLAQTANARMERVLGDVQQRLADHLKRMSERLVTDVDDKTGEPKHRRFHDTLVSSAYELCDLIKDMPTLKGHDVDLARQQLEEALGDASAQTLRDDPIKREHVKQQVDDMIGKFAFTL
jgi:hypothetical protein